MLHQEGQFQQLVYVLLEFAVLHGFCDLGYRGVGEPFVCGPSIDESELKFTLFGLFDDEVAQKLFHHLLRGEVELGVEPQHFGQRRDPFDRVFDGHDFRHIATFYIV